MLNDEKQLADIENESFAKPVMLFKNSSRCGISYSILESFKEDLLHSGQNNFSFYIVDIVDNRALSSAISAYFDVRHESPQLLVILKGECIYHQSHWNISFDETMRHIELRS